MNNNDNVPAPVAYSIFAVLGVLIVAVFVYAGSNVVRWRQNMAQTELALGKATLEPPEPQYEEEPEDYATPDKLYRQPATLLVRGNEVSFDEQGITTVGDDVFVPVRGIFEALDYVVTWDEDTGTAMFSGAANTVVLTIDEYVFTLNGKKLPLAQPARFVDETPMFPLIGVLESAGYNVAIDEETNTIDVTVRRDPPPRPEPTPEPTPTPQPAAPRPRATPAPTPSPIAVTCATCMGSGRVICVTCNGIGGGRGRPLVAGIPYEMSAVSDVWWCTVCLGAGTVDCPTSAGTGIVFVTVTELEE